MPAAGKTLVAVQKITAAAANAMIAWTFRLPAERQIR
jgi:hypothetical protein